MGPVTTPDDAPGPGPEQPERPPHDAGATSWTPQPSPSVPHLSDEAYARAFAEIERAAASWAPSAHQRHRHEHRHEHRHLHADPQAWPPAAPDPRAWPQPRRRRRGGWFVLALVLVATVVVLDRGLGPERLGPSIDVPREQWLGEPRGLGGDGPRPGVDEQPARLLPAVTPTRTGPYELLSLTATWSPCRPIRVVVDPTDAPRGFEGWLGQVLAEASELSGLSIVLEGQTDERVSFDREPYQPSRYGERWVPVVVGWADEATLPGLAGTVAGLGGAQHVTRGNQTGYVSGSVALDVDLLDMPRQQGEPAYVGVLRHEVGHLLGLGHVDAPESLMYGGPNSISRWGPGEIEGLAVLGAGTCTPYL